jgi:hypothetical protein
MSETVWAPGRAEIAPSDLLARIAALRFAGREPLAAASCDLLGAISGAILADPVARQIPQHVALAYWLRPAALARLRSALAIGSENADSVRAPRGVALHLPPTNVDTIFVYSWAISVLAGNANVVRLGRTLSPAAERLVGIVADAVARFGDAERQIFCTYAYGGALEREIAEQCDLRLIWGGDEKVRQVGRVPIRPDGLSLGFPNRHSFSVIASDAYAAAGEGARDALAAGLYNDVFWFDQMGCGSPRILFWRGEPAPGLRADLRRRLLGVAARKRYAVETGIAIRKMALGHDLLADGVTAAFSMPTSVLGVSEVIEPAAFLARAMGGGFLGEMVVGTLAEIVPFIAREAQTLTHFGIAAADLRSLAEAVAGRGLYRIVPVGSALSFDVDWDGVSLFDHATRRIVVRTAG